MRIEIPRDRVFDEKNGFPCSPVVKIEERRLFEVKKELQEYKYKFCELQSKYFTSNTKLDHCKKEIKELKKTLNMYRAKESIKEILK